MGGGGLFRGELSWQGNISMHQLLYGHARSDHLTIFISFPLSSTISSFDIVTAVIFSDKFWSSLATRSLAGIVSGGLMVAVCILVTKFGEN